MGNVLDEMTDGQIADEARKAASRFERRAGEEHSAGLLTRLADRIDSRLWRSIDTAPKDGTRFLASVEGIVGLTFWMPSTGQWWNGFTGRSHQPTHWMPLPDPPRKDRPAG